MIATSSVWGVVYVYHPVEAKFSKVWMATYIATYSGSNQMRTECKFSVGFIKPVSTERSNVWLDL